MDILEKAKEHFASLAGGEIEVPEWGLTIYWRPFTGQDRSRLLAQVKASGNDGEINARCVILKAHDKDGKKCFDAGHLRALMTEVDPAIVDRIANMMMPALPTPEEAEKN